MAIESGVMMTLTLAVTASAPCHVEMAERSGVMMTLTLAVTASALCHVEAWLRDGNRVWGDGDIDTSCHCKCTVSCGSMAERWQ